MNYKKFKDPLYGYISIPAEYVTQIIDSPAFQRLRRITQTSYAPLYSSAVHNRFIHSLGVYHLGCIACGTICNEIIRTHLNDERLNMKELFEEKWFRVMWLIIGSMAILKFLGLF